MKENSNYAEEIVKSIKILWAKNFLAAGDGNFSYKFDGQIFISPSGCRKVDLSPDAFVPLGHSEKASSESLMHKIVYEKTKAQVVFHAHPPAAIAWSIANDEKHLPEDLMSELVLSAGRIPVADYARPGTQSMADNLIDFLPEARIIILKHHGALVWGETVQEALNGMERLEHTCEILLKISSYGGVKSRLSESEVEWLYEKRKDLGDKIL